MFIAYLATTFALGLSVYRLRRARLGNIALLLFSLALCVTSLEAYYRFIYAESDGLGLLSKNFIARYYRYDGYGLRASNLPLAETKNNVVIVGDSHVFGAGLKSTAERFSEKVAAHYPDLHVVNLGLPSWDTKTEIAQVAKYLGETRAPIPLVVLTYFFNDIEEDVTAVDRGRLIPAVRAPEPQRSTTSFSLSPNRAGSSSCSITGSVTRGWCGIVSVRSRCFTAIPRSWRDTWPRSKSSVPSSRKNMARAC